MSDSFYGPIDDSKCQECGAVLKPDDEFVCADCAITMSAIDDATWD